MFLPITLVSLVVTLSNAADPCFNTSQLCNATASCCNTTTNETCLDPSDPYSFCAQNCTVDGDCEVKNQTCRFDGVCVFKCETTNLTTNVTGNCSTGSICIAKEVNTIGFCAKCANESQPCYNWSCCKGLTCDGGTNETQNGTCQKKNKGFSLFDMSFSLKHLVGIAVVMVATWSL